MAEGRAGASAHLADEGDSAVADAAAAATAAGEEAPGFAHDSGCAFCERPDCPARGDLLAVRRPCFVGYLPLKNAAKWRKCQTYGALYVGDLFLPIKLPSDFEPDADHTVAALVRAHPRVRCVVDLTNHCSSVYSCEGTPVVHEKLMLTVRGSSRARRPRSSVARLHRPSRAPAAPPTALHSPRSSLYEVKEVGGEAVIEEGGEDVGGRGSVLSHLNDSPQTDAEVREFNRRVTEFLVTAPADAIIAGESARSRGARRTDV